MELHTHTLPEELAREAAEAWANIRERAGEALSAEISNALEEYAAPEQLARVLALSPFIAGTFRARPLLLQELLRSDQLQASLEEDRYEGDLRTALEEEGAELDTVLRRFRAWLMVRIICRDFCRLADTFETIRDTSALAQACIRQALDWHHAALEQRFGTPRGRESGQAQQLIVLAMGKLGARELNVSSDIDLNFAYPELGATDGEAKQLSNEEFFTRVGRGVINALDQINAEGFVFRVDMRLRPYGESGALVHNFSALEEYYQDQGRDWERYALIKARPVTGDPEQGQQLMDALRPFVFRRYVDFGVIESLRSMKQMINSEVRRRGLDEDIKLGHGGIREVEFIAQCFQLIRGGRDLGLQQRELLPVLKECAELGCLPETAVDELRQAYLFLRDSEHAIQGYQDKQSQALPTDELPRLAMATAMGFADWDAYKEALDGHRQRVLRHFDELIAEPDEETSEAPDELPLWGEGLCVESLQSIGFERAPESEQSLQELRQSPRVATLQVEGRERLEQFMPQLLRACSEVKYPDLALQRVLPLVVAVLRRSAYLALLLENPPALRELVVLCAASPWIAEQMSQHPALLDEFLDRASLYTAPDKALLQDELRQQVARLALDDLEAQMEALRYFKASHVLRVAASELAERLPLMQVSDKLTWIAEVILEQVLAVAWADMTRKYGEPARDRDRYGFAVYGYGKLGGIELGYGSDLDLVFVSDAHGQGVTDGERTIDNTVFYTRLGQRMIHILETRMALGQLYEVDMRLRPSGESGMLVTTVRGFSSYQEQSAWTWEHQALVRARFVAGDMGVAQKVDGVRREVLCLQREEGELALEVQRMRNRMREHLLPDGDTKDGEFHLKQGHGGIVDIEFMVQYAVLAWSHRVPELAHWSDNVRILETLGREGIFEQSECDALTEAYLAYRSAAHQLSLQQQPGVVPADRFADLRNAVEAKWRQLFAAYPVTEQKTGESDESGRS
jgi:glutamate-ammonia-ligase adenylyltransferase